MRPFWDALSDAMAASGRSLLSICEGAGVDYDRMKQGRGRGSKIDVLDAIRIANELGYSLDEFVKAPNIEDRAEIVRTYNSLTPREIRLLKAGAVDDPDDQAPPAQSGS